MKSPGGTLADRQVDQPKNALAAGQGGGLTWKCLRQSIPGCSENTPGRIAEFPRPQREVPKPKTRSPSSPAGSRRPDRLVWFCDEAGVRLTPPVPYGWQKIGEATRIRTLRGGEIQTLGFLSTACDLQPVLH